MKDRIRKYLAEEGLANLSKRLEITRQHIWALLTGKSLPSEDLLKDLGFELQPVTVKVPKLKRIPNSLNLSIYPRKDRHPRIAPADRELYIRVSQWAQQIVCRAVKRGELINLRGHEVPCTDCRVRRAIHYDHRNYAKPLEVVPVCQNCNLKRGPAIIYGIVENHRIRKNDVKKTRKWDRRRSPCRCPLCMKDIAKRESVSQLPQ